jgi:hypothetical protein
MAYDVSRLGEVNTAGGDAKELFMKIFAGEVLTAFETNNLMMGLTSTRTISQGKSASFPVTGKIGSSYHTPGEEITGSKIGHNERIISIDGLLISDAFIANIDEAMNHYDVRSIYSTEMGRELAKRMDINVLKETVLAARASSAVDGLPGGTEIINDSFQNDGGVEGAATTQEQAEALAAGLFTLAQTFDEKDVPEQNRVVIFKPAEYYILAQNLDLINNLYGGQGAIAEGNIIKVAGITIEKSNNLPTTDTSSTDTYHGVDSTKTVGVGLTKEAVGTVKLMDLALEKDYQVERQGTLMVAKYAVGHDTLRPECARELKLDTLVN